MFYIDYLFNIPKYDHFDPVVKAAAISNAIDISQAESSRVTSYFLDGISGFSKKDIPSIISRQNIYNWLKKWNVPEIVHESIDTPETLNIMVDEKFIGSQDLNKDIMVKCFVAFEGVENVSKGRRALINRHVFSCHKKAAWPCFMDYISKIYDFDKIKHINLLADGASWIKVGIQELKLSPSNKVKQYLCQLHFRQAINRMTPEQSKRNEILQSFKNKTKKDFKTFLDNLILELPEREK